MIWLRVQVWNLGTKCYLDGCCGDYQISCMSHIKTLILYSITHWLKLAEWKCMNVTCWPFNKVFQRTVLAYLWTYETMIKLIRKQLNIRQNHLSVGLKIKCSSFNRHFYYITLHPDFELFPEVLGIETINLFI